DPALLKIYLLQLFQRVVEGDHLCRSFLWDYQCFVQRKSRIRITSLVCVPRERASCLPSRERSNQKIWSDLKSVSCFGAPPSRGSDQMLETPLIVSMKVRARPSGVQRRPAMMLKLCGKSSILTGSPPAKGMMATL